MCIRDSDWPVAEPHMHIIARVFYKTDIRKSTYILYGPQAVCFLTMDHAYNISNTAIIAQIDLADMAHLK